MVSTIQIGREAEARCEAILVEQGYKVHRTVRSSHYGLANDIFGCIDIIAKKRGERTRWIQVTAGGGIGEKVEDIEEMADAWDPDLDSVEVWMWKGIKQKKGVTRARWESKRYFQVRRRERDYAIRTEEHPEEKEWEVGYSPQAD